MDAGTVINYQFCYESALSQPNCDISYGYSGEHSNTNDFPPYSPDSLADPDIHDFINLILPNYVDNMTPQSNFVTGDSESDTDSVMISQDEWHEFSRQDDYLDPVSDSSVGSGQFDYHHPPPVPSPVYHPYNNQTLPSFDELVQSTNKHYSSTTRLCVSDDEGDEESEAIVKKGKRGAKNILLWKFLLDELANVHQKHIRWISCKEGTFRFVDTAEISKMWGAKKRKNDMNFEKLSRGIRHYYKSGFMRREDGTRLVYKFNWKKVPKEYRRRFAL